jgi:hypothetical protein
MQLDRKRPEQKLRRVAVKLHAIYQQRFAREDLQRKIEANRLETCTDEARRRRAWMETARRKGWDRAAAHQERAFLAALQACSQAAGALAEHWCDSARSLPSFNDLYAELHALQEEFDRVEFDLANKTLAVHTASIVLEETNLGPFRIKLAWPQLTDRAGSECFDVVALEPRPASRDDGVTHPHVRGHRLCAGDAAIALQKAVAQGRLCDAFQMIRSVLETYNPDSAYVALDDWEGAACWNCSSHISGDDLWFCSDCDHDVCHDCIAFCGHCDRYACDSCQTHCDECNGSCCRRCLQKSACSARRCCPQCLKTCLGCKAAVATSEIHAATQRCPLCRSIPPEPLDASTPDASLPAFHGELS